MALLLSLGCRPSEGETTDSTPTTWPTATTATTADTATTETCTTAVHVGTGEATFEPIGAVLPIVSGPQGGWHLLGAARICNLGNEATVQFEATRKSDGLIVGRSGPVSKPLVPLDACCYGVSDVFTYLNIKGEQRPDLVLDGEDVRLDVVVTLPDETKHVDGVDTTLDAGL